jgi:gas vesicle protein
MSEEKKSTRSFIWGFLAGGTIGAILALLYAPKSGKELRSDLRKKTTSLLNEAEEYFDLAKNKTIDLINDAKNKSEELVTRAKIRAESLMEEGDEILSKARDSSIESDTSDEYPISGLDAYKKEKI